jgi:hypothetical protein
MYRRHLICGSRHDETRGGYIIRQRLSPEKVKCSDSAAAIGVLMLASFKSLIGFHLIDFEQAANPLFGRRSIVLKPNISLRLAERSNRDSRRF